MNWCKANLTKSKNLPPDYRLGKRWEGVSLGIARTTEVEPIDKARYRDLLIRSIHQVLQPLGMGENDLSSLVVGGARQLELWPQEDGWVEDGEDTSLAEDLFGPFRDYR